MPNFQPPSPDALFLTSAASASILAVVPDSPTPLDSSDARTLAEARRRQLDSVQRFSIAGTGNIDKEFGLDRKFRLVFVRTHFSGGDGTAPMSISIDSGLGLAWDSKLFTILVAGIGADVNFRVVEEESVEPSAWTFQANDKLRIQWTNPDPSNMTWGIEIGLAPAS